MKLLHLALLLFTLLPLGCALAPPTRPFTDVATDSTALTPAATRVVALTPITADIIHWLDATKLIGISGSQLLDQNATLQDLPRVSEGRTQPNLEQIVALEPDLVIGGLDFMTRCWQSCNRSV